MSKIGVYDYGPKWKKELDEEIEELVQYFEALLQEFRALNNVNESKRKQNWEVAKTRVKYPWQ